MYKVVKFFTDAQDNGYAYNVGDTYPRDGKVVDESRIKSLLTSANRQKTPMITKVEIHIEPLVQQETVEQEVTPLRVEEDIPKTKRGRKSKN